MLEWRLAAFAEREERPRFALSGDRLARVLARLDVVLDAEPSDLDSLFNLIALRVGRPRGPSVRQVRDRLWQRHRRESPPVVSGLCLPHAAIPVLQSQQLVYLRLARPFVTGSGAPVQDALALLIPRPGLDADLQLLQRLQQLFARPENLAALRQGQTEAAVRARVAALA